MNDHIARTIAQGILNFAESDVLEAQLASMPRIRVVRVRHRQQEQPPSNVTSNGSIECKVEGKIDQKCSICLNEFKVGEKMTCLPCQPNNMPHRFHSECLEPWFIRHRNCPVCRTQYY